MLPNLIVIGAAKAGTTTLHHHLGLHPDVAMSTPKELRFFLNEFNWSRGPEWYAAQFPDDAPVRGEASPRYTAYPFVRDVPARMAAIVPDAMLIYVVRDPVERIVSDYEMYVHSGEDQPLAEVIRDFDASYIVARSRYYLQLERFLRYYDSERILVLDAADLDEATDATMAQVFRYVGVDPFTSSDFALRKNVSREPPRERNARGERVVRVLDRAVGGERSQALRAAAPRALHAPFSRRRGSAALPADLRARLKDYLRDDAARLREHTGLRFASWSI